MGAQERSDVRIIGSFLLVETTTAPSDDLKREKVIVIRATNPTEDGNREFRSGDYVENAIAYATETAEARRLDQVLLCYEESRGGHASNETNTIKAMIALNRKHKWPKGPRLENIPETNFNGYPVWMPSETRVVWTRKGSKESAQNA